MDISGLGLEAAGELTPDVMMLVEVVQALPEELSGYEGDVRKALMVIVGAAGMRRRQLTVLGAVLDALKAEKLGTLARVVTLREENDELRAEVERLRTALYSPSSQSSS
jgi:hypothetical protein